MGLASWTAVSPILVCGTTRNCRPAFPEASPFRLPEFFDRGSKKARVEVIVHLFRRQFALPLSQRHMYFQNNRECPIRRNSESCKCHSPSSHNGSSERGAPRFLLLKICLSAPGFSPWISDENPFSAWGERLPPRKAGPRRGEKPQMNALLQVERTHLVPLRHRTIIYV